jgi:CheY-like chemotaxis protein
MRPVILLLDTDTAFRELVSSRLKSLGFVALGTGDSLTGLRLARRTTPAAVMLSADMPGVGREDLLDVIRQIPTLARTRVILLSAAGTTVRPQRCGRGLEHVVIGNRFRLTPLVRQLATLAEEHAAAATAAAATATSAPDAGGAPPECPDDSDRVA